MLLLCENWTQVIGWTPFSSSGSCLLSQPLTESEMLLPVCCWRCGCEAKIDKTPTRTFWDDQKESNKRLIRYTRRSKCWKVRSSGRIYVFRGVFCQKEKKLTDNKDPNQLRMHPGFQVSLWSIDSNMLSLLQVSVCGETNLLVWRSSWTYASASILPPSLEL